MTARIDPASISSPTRRREDTAISFRDVEKRYGSIRALRDVGFTVPKGSLCGLVGPNGAGKTTTIRILATDLDPTEGEVEILGCRLPADTDRLRPRIGYMPDSAGLYEELTLEEYLGFFGSVYGLSGAARRRATETAMELAGVADFSGRRLSGLSKGERQRILLARSLINDPELLILDEPADGLDPRGRVELRELLRLLHERGKTILISSHILADLEEIVSDLVLIDRGRVVFEGSRDRLFAGGLQRARLRIETIGPAEPLARSLSSRDGIVVLDCQESRIELDVPADPAWSAALLRSLVAGGTAVCSFARSPESLESIYLRMTDREEG